MTYSKLLIAVDATDDANLVIAGAQRVAGPGTQHHLITVVEPLTSVYSSMVWGQLSTNTETIEKALVDESLVRLKSLADRHGLDNGLTHVHLGTPSVVIREQAEELDVDMIVIGTHARRGVGLLLGSTANSVLHGVTRDVLVIRLGLQDT